MSLELPSDLNCQRRNLEEQAKSDHEAYQSCIILSFRLNDYVMALYFARLYAFNSSSPLENNELEFSTPPQAYKFLAMAHLAHRINRSTEQFHQHETSKYFDSLVQNDECLLESAFHYILTRDVSSSRDILKRALSFDSPPATLLDTQRLLWLLSSFLFTMEKKFTEASRTIEMILEKYPNDILANCLLLSIQRETHAKKSEKSKCCRTISTLFLKQHVQMSPNLQTNIVSLVLESYFDMNHWQKALQWFESVSDIFSDRPAQLTYFQTRLHETNPKVAASTMALIENYERCLFIDPSFVYPTSLRLALLYKTLSKHIEARFHLLNVIKHKPYSVEAHYHLGKILNEMDHEEMAEKTLLMALSLEKTRPSIDPEEFLFDDIMSRFISNQSS